MPRSRLLLVLMLVLTMLTAACGGATTLDEADAGIVYTTDAATITNGSISTLDIPDNLNTIATYPIAALKGAKNTDLAKKFVDNVLGPDGQQILVKYGFIPTTGSATGAAPTAAPLAIGGLDDTPTTLTLDAFNKLDQVEVKATDKSGEQTSKASDSQPCSNRWA